MLMYCPKFKIKIEQTYKDNCPSCIFYRQKEDEDGHFYLVCTYLEWIPGLKDKNESNT